MKRGSAPAAGIDEYIAAFPADVQKKLQDVRAAISKAAPEAEEAMKYGIPSFVLGGNLVHFGGFKTHVGFYPTPSGIEAFKEELSNYKLAKGSVQFPLDRRMPLALITKIVKYRVREVEGHRAGKKRAAPSPRRRGGGEQDRRLRRVTQAS